MKRLFTLLMVALMCIVVSAQIAPDAYRKWHENKYSMFIHFGLYSVANKSNLLPEYSATGMEILP